MNLIATVRRYQRPRARTVLGVLMLMWLNIVLQPRVMAAPAVNMADVDPVRVHDAQIIADDSTHEPDDKCPRRFDCGHVILVKGGYTPDVVIVQRGPPV